MNAIIEFFSHLLVSREAVMLLIIRTGDLAYFTRSSSLEVEWLGYGSVNIFICVCFVTVRHVPSSHGFVSLCVVFLTLLWLQKAHFLLLL